jgi:hypothetical protein
MIPNSTSGHQELRNNNASELPNITSNNRTPTLKISSELFESSELHDSSELHESSDLLDDDT